ncbi:PTS sugar transporter subunit IIA [candidate division TA06 bacterium]|uniref:PTS sugar transporter subunit IIA n=1 Tax=candidate division TA06 bacterium TaxID=2250710 RepID=A0A523XTX6_UNCT6|nr:MAG: PTS sugar transporter subunit IIA [candidate division TA06 bacterium]
MIADLLSENSIKLNMSAGSKEEAIQELVGLLVSNDDSLDGKSLFESARDRENRMSTGLGKGVAVFRCRSEDVKQICCSLGIRHGGVEFDAVDGIPVEIFFMIAAPKKVDDTYVRILCRLYRILNQETFRSHLLGARSAKEVFSLVSEEEKEFED